MDSPEDFTNGGEHDIEPGDLEPVTVETKQKLIDTIDKKTEGRPLHDFFAGKSRGVDLRVRGREDLVLNLRFTPQEERKSVDGRSFIALAQRNIGKPLSMWRVERYKVYETADRTVEIEKGVTSIDGKAEYEQSLADDLAAKRGDWGALVESSQAAIRMIEEAQEGVKRDQEIGLGFVPEKEAVALLRDLELAQPFERFKL